MRQVKTKSGATAVQVVTRRVFRFTDKHTLILEDENQKSK